EQPPLRTSHRPSRTRARPSPPDLVARAFEPASRAFRHIVLGRGLGALVGIPPLGFEIHRDARGSHGRTFLARAPLRADYLFAEIPPRRMDAAAVRGFPRRARRPRP